VEAISPHYSGKTMRKLPGGNWKNAYAVGRSNDKIWTAELAILTGNKKPPKLIWFRKQCETGWFRKEINPNDALLKLAPAGFDRYLCPT